MAGGFTLLLRLAIFLACALYMFYSVDLKRSFAALLSVDPLWVALATVCIVMSVTMNGARVRLLASRRIGLWSGVNTTVLALAANIVLPGRLGEVAKVGALRVLGLPLRETLRIVFIERLIDLNMSGTIALTFLGLSLGRRQPWLMAALGLAWVLLFLVLSRPDWLRPLLAWVLSKVKRWARLQSWLGTAFDAVFERTPRDQLPGLLAYSSLGLAAYFLANGLVIRYGCGVDLPWLSVFSATCVGMLSLAVPATPAGIGVYEAGLVWVLGLYGIGGEQALAAALVSHAIQIVPILPWAGLISLLTRGRQAALLKSGD